MFIITRKQILLISAILLGQFLTACNRTESPKEPMKPSIKAAPLGQQLGRWQLITSDNLKLTINAPEAERIRILYRPTDVQDSYKAIRRIDAPPKGDQYSIDLKVGQDFAGDVWAEAEYADGTRKRTDSLTLATKEAVAPAATDVPADSVGGSPDTDESARSDKLTDGKINQNSIVKGDSRVWITMNVPAFQLTLWQNGSEVKRYQIGVGREDFPVPIGPRKASEIIWNPDWLPPDSEWVLESENVDPGERITADDPRNPLGKIKIRLGQGILIHEAASPSDIGHLVSHGCIRMMKDDLFELARWIVAARDLPLTQDQIDQAQASSDRLAAKIEPPLWVDVNYDTDVIENSVLHLYPDVYNRVDSPVDSLRADLSGNLKAGDVETTTLEQMINRVSPTEEFKVSITDLKGGRSLTKGENQPLTSPSTNPPT